ncbi:sensor histidine kinase [Streptacidiphilus griseoplanus]|uniref:sensor histidine kinase n=1 Tax=Peterkaempfera griseoplana TaxID=66896 RepID=UPI0012FF3650|nr:histidine kinase [Peterkaempfera griseoplana]
MNNSTNRLLERLVHSVMSLAGLGVLLSLGIVDMVLGLARPSVITLAALVAVITWRLSGRALGSSALVLGLIMLLTTVSPDSTPVAILPFGVTATAVTLLVIGLSAWRAEPTRATVAIPLLLGSLVLGPVQLSATRIAPVVSLALALAGVIAGATGLWARMLQTGRRRQAVAEQLAQRASIASDLHDYVAHHVTGIVVLAQAAQSVAAKQPQAVLPALERIEAAGDEAMTAIRRMVALLHEPGSQARLTPMGTIADIASLADHFTSGDDVKVRLNISGDFDDVPIDVQSAAHRVVMEALTNVRRHAEGVQALEILVHRDTRPDSVTVEVSNDGRARVGHVAAGGYGLAGLRDRALALGGSFTAGPRTPDGWTVQARFPTEGAR